MISFSFSLLMIIPPGMPRMIFKHAGYDNRIRVKYTAKWGVQIAGMIFQTRSNITYVKTQFPDIF